MKPLNEIPRRQRWRISDDDRSAVIQRLRKIIDDPASSVDEVTAAARVMMNAEKQNQHDDDKFELDADRGRNRFLERALELGITKPPERLPDPGNEQ